MERTKKITSILLVFLLTIGVCCNFKVFAQEIDVSMPKEEYNKNIKEEFGLDENGSTEKNAQELGNILVTMTLINMEKKDWFSVNEHSDLISLYIYDYFVETNPNKTYNVSYSTKDDGYIRAFTIDGLEYEYSGVMPTDEKFGIPFDTSEVWNSDIKKIIPQNPSEMSGKDLKKVLGTVNMINKILTENNPKWGLTVNGKASQEDMISISNSIKNDADYKVEYTMDNGYIRHFKIEEITASIPTPVPSETEQEENPSNPTESQKDTQNQESNKQHILDDEPKTGL